jgi:hypothetical protein
MAPAVISVAAISVRITTKRESTGAAHHVGLLRLEGQRERQGHRRDEVDPEDLRRQHRQQKLLHAAYVAEGEGHHRDHEDQQGSVLSAAQA